MIRRGDIAHLGHVELLTPKPSREPLVLRGGARDGARGGGGRIRLPARVRRLRALLPQADRVRDVRAGPSRAARVRARRRSNEPSRASRQPGRGGGWSDGDIGHGPAYRFTDPDGRRFEIYYETERYGRPSILAPPMLNQKQRRTGRGVGVRRLEHVNFVSPDVRACRRFLEETLGYRSLRDDRARRRPRVRRMAERDDPGPRDHLRPREPSRSAAASTTPRSGSIPARRYCARRTSSRTTGSSSRRDRRSTRRSTRSTCTCTSPAGTASR